MEQTHRARAAYQSGSTSAREYQVASGTLLRVPRPSCAESHVRAEHASAIPFGLR